MRTKISKLKRSITSAVFIAAFSNAKKFGTACFLKQSGLPASALKIPFLFGNRTKEKDAVTMCIQPDRFIMVVSSGYCTNFTSTIYEPHNLFKETISI